MGSSAEVIVLSSSPRQILQTPTKSACDTEKLFEISPPAATPPSLSSPSGLFQLPSRSRFFPSPSVPDSAKKKKKAQKNTAGASLNVNEKNASTKSRPRVKKVVKEPASGVLGDLEPVSIDSKSNAAKKPTRAQKSRTKSTAKSKEHGNMTLAGKVTKSSNEPSTKQASKNGKKASAKLGSSTEQPGGAGSRTSNAIGVDEELHLDEATRRRMNWTPPRETIPQETHETGVDDNTASDGKPGDSFGKLLSDYNYSACVSGTAGIATMAHGVGPTKRRRIELVDPQVYPLSSKRFGANEEPSAQEEDSSSSGAQTKKQKPKGQKRFRTLTARMTAQYTTNNAEHEDLEDLLVPDISKTRSRQGKSKMDNRPGFIVVSPETAAKTLDDQDLIFGTCSQLERDDSPETLRAMQQAIRESESVNFGEKSSDAKSGGTKIAAPQSESNRSVSRRTGAKSLWSVATRDTEGSLVQARHLDTVDLTGATPAPRTKNVTPVKTSAGILEDDWFDQDYGRPTAPTRRCESLSGKFSKPANEPRISPVAGVAASDQKRQAEVIENRQGDSQQPSVPHYEGFTDAELSKQVAAYGFKSVRGRKKMIELLRKCWESKHGSSANNAETRQQPQPSSQPNPSSMVPSQVQKDTVATQTKSKPNSKGKTKSKPSTCQPESSRAMTPPKKNSRKASKTEHPPSSSFIGIDEIQDSEEEAFLSPNQVQKRYTEIYSNAPSLIRESSLEFLPRTAPQISTERKIPISKSSAASKSQLPSNNKPGITESSKRSSHPDISAQITKAVRSQSANLSSPGDRSHPTWHEKILMYDPIVLEDFTTWLNVEGLELVGEDREIGTAIVREWCESKGICCCWKKNASW